MFWYGFFVGLFALPALLIVGVSLFALANKSEIQLRLNYEKGRDL
jgi:hypothetical protein